MGGVIEWSCLMGVVMGGLVIELCTDSCPTGRSCKDVIYLRGTKLVFISGICELSECITQ